jgi:hypothetical protein
METSPLKFHFALTPEDLRSIREAIRRWGKPAECIDGFTGAELYRHFERWQQFVETNWADWDRSEYDHDIGCRFWVQLAIENSSPGTHTVLEQQVARVDAPAKRPTILESAPLSHHPYFWESHTIHPEL